ncbi:hypothetical protein [Rhizomonospora bruguierae]|uniref:hypothetical protein n=1 Tax=Rhizomonospora bruguierae TaxID=1581705 RepID=UPI0020BE0EB3|nr:hypothetical protein [Micromonospora sp. NBRC 107566]
MNSVLSAIVYVVSLAVAVYALVEALVDRPPGRIQVVGLGLVEAAVLALSVGVLVDVIGGGRPAETATFIGYLLTTLLLPPAGVALARMEPTRWGSTTVCGAALIVPVLVVRLGQVWHG